MGVAMAPRPGTNFAMTRAQASSLRNQSRVELTQESGSREMRQSRRRTEAPRRRPSVYQKLSARADAASTMNIAWGKDSRWRPINAPLASRMGTEGSGAPSCSTSTQVNRTQVPWRIRNSRVWCISTLL